MLGWVRAASRSLGGVSGLGGNTANDALPEANLSALVWSPIGNTKWSPTDDTEAVLIYGPNGVVIRDQGSNCRIVLTKTGIDIYPPAGVPTVVHGSLAIEGNLLLGGDVLGETGAVYPGTIATSGRLVAGKGTGDEVDVQGHTHNYNRTTGASTVAATNPANPNPSV